MSHFERDDVAELATIILHFTESVMAFTEKAQGEIAQGGQVTLADTAQARSGSRVQWKQI